MEDYKEKYENALNWAKSIYPTTKGSNKEDLEHYFPELKESEDEKIRKALIECIREIDCEEGFYAGGYDADEICAWLEKQKDINSKEYVFRPHLSCNINTAAIQAVGQQKLGNKIVLAFNGAYIPVEGKTADDIVNEYYSWIKKRGSEPNWCHHKVDLSDCSKEYCKAYYDGWNNCNQQHAQLEAQRKPTWSEEDEIGFADTLWAIQQARTIAKDENDMGNLWYAENWLKSLKQRLGGK